MRVSRRNNVFGKFRLTTQRHRIIESDWNVLFKKVPEIIPDKRIDHFLPINAGASPWESTNTRTHLVWFRIMRQRKLFPTFHTKTRSESEATFAEPEVRIGFLAANKSPLLPTPAN